MIRKEDCISYLGVNNGQEEETFPLSMNLCIF